jgi:hypothetical protein
MADDFLRLRRPRRNPLGGLSGEVDGIQLQLSDRYPGRHRQAAAAHPERRSRGESAAQAIAGRCRGRSVLPVKLGNFDPFVYEFDVGEYGDLGFTGNFFFGLTWQVYRFIGNQGLLYWVYDAPEAIHRLMEYMLADRFALFEFFEREGLLAANTDNQMAGPRMYGYVSDLPEPTTPRRSSLKHLWGWAESQEAAAISPSMYQEFVLPYLAQLSRRFGLDLLRLLRARRRPARSDHGSHPESAVAFPFPAGPICKDGRAAGTQLCVLAQTRFPRTSAASSPIGNCWNGTCATPTRQHRDCNVEILYRDIYTIDGDRARLRRWVDMTKDDFPDVSVCVQGRGRQ